MHCSKGMSRGQILFVIPSVGFPGAPVLALAERFSEHLVPYGATAPFIGRCQGTGGVVITATMPFSRVRVGELGGLVILDSPDGRLREDRSALELVRAADREHILVAGVGEGALVLMRAGVLRGSAVAADRESADHLAAFGVAVLFEPLVTHDHVVTTTERGAAALGDAIHDLRGPSRLGPEPAP
jgi:transcriptional regulator GlxA family with amidase domain